MIGRLLILGATGDLAGRYLLPALAELIEGGDLPPAFEIVGAATEEWTSDRFRRHAAERLRSHGGGASAGAREALVRGLRYERVDFQDRDGLSRLLAGPPLAAYLALPPAVFAPAVAALGAAGLPDGSRIAVEKPFGEDLRGARELNQLLARVAGGAGEAAVFRVDHVLGLHPVENLLSLRLANRVPGLVWSGEHVARVEIFWEETLGLEGRAGFYDHTGALKDVVQNHMMQLLALVAMDPPDGEGEGPLRRSKVEALRAVRPPRAHDMAARTRRARYTAGRLYDDEGHVRADANGYADEPGVDAARGTETYAEIEVDVDSARWRGTRFVLRAGKALRHRRKGVWLTFRTMAGAAPARRDNALWVGIDGPRDISLHCLGSEAAAPPRPQPVVLKGNPPDGDLPAYGRVLLDLLHGRGGLSVGASEAEEAWRIVTPVIDAWADGRVPLEEYPAGATGLAAERAPAREATWAPR
jgi:glucose-6-phosphate 1-dehydrogenase